MIHWFQKLPASLGRVFQGDRVWGKAVSAYALVALFCVSLLINPSIYVSDEVTYALMVQGFSDGGFGIGNDLGFSDSEELHLYSTVRVGDELVGIPPPLYPIIAYPFYAFLGVWGLFFLNSLCFAGSLLLVYLICCRLFGGGKLAFSAVLVYSLPLYSAKYALELWPHMLSVFLVLCAAYLAIRGELLLSGLVAGVSVGVRYTDLLVAAVFGVYVLSRYRLRGGILYGLGAFLACSVTAFLNYRIFGGFVTGYHRYISDSGVIAGLDPRDSVCFFAASALAFASYHILAGRRIRTRLLFSAFSALAVVLFFSCPPDAILDSLKVFLAQFFDIQSHPAGSVLYVKKSLFQASPVLVLSFLAAFSVRAGKAERFLLLAPTVSLALFYASYFTRHGGNVLFVRYLLEGIPFLSILAAAFMHRNGVFRTQNKVSALTYLSLLFLVFTVLCTASFDNEGLAFWCLRILPLFLTATLLFSALRIRRGRSFFMAALALSVSYGVAVNASDIIFTYASRQTNEEILAELSYVEPGSVIMFGEYLDQVTLALLKTSRDVTLADTSRDNLTDAPHLLSRYLADERSVYLFDSNSTRFSEFIARVNETRESILIETEHTRMYLVGAEGG